MSNRQFGRKWVMDNLVENTEKIKEREMSKEPWKKKIENPKKGKILDKNNF